MKIECRLPHLPIRIETESEDSAVERHTQRIKDLQQEDTEVIRRCYADNLTVRIENLKRHVDISREIFREQIRPRVPAERNLVILGKRYSLPPKLVRH